MVMTKKQIIKSVAQDFVDGKNANRPKNEQPATVETLFNFGQMGLCTPLQIAEAFYNSITHYQRKK